jgi:hypothetical protein
MIHHFIICLSWQQLKTFFVFESNKNLPVRALDRMAENEFH